MGDAYSAHPEYVLIVAAIVMLDVWGCIPFSRLREQSKAGTFVTLKLINIVLQVLLAVGFWRIGLFDSAFGVGWAFVANLIASLVTTSAVIVATGTIAPRIDRAILAAVFAYSLPLLLSGIAGTANEFIDRQMIKYLVPEGAMAQLGIYGAITKIAVVMTLFTQMYRLAAEPFFLSNFKREDFVAMNAAALKYFVMFSMAIFLGIALYRDIFALIVGAQFREGIFILPVVLGANILSGVWLNLSFWYKREEKTRFALWITLSGLAFSVIGGMILIPRAGYFGAAWSRFAARSGDGRRQPRTQPHILPDALRFQAHRRIRNHRTRAVRIERNARPAAAGSHKIYGEHGSVRYLSGIRRAARENRRGSDAACNIETEIKS